MKLTSKVINVLKIFYNINPSIKFISGDVIKTMAPSKSIIAQAKVDVEFGPSFCIYDLSRFLSVVSLFDNPVLAFPTTQTVEIYDESASATYFCCAENLIARAPAKNIVMPESAIAAKFNLSNAELQKLFKAMAVIGLPEVAFVGDGKSLSVMGVDSEEKNLDTYKMEVGETSKTFKGIFKIDNLNKIMPADYEVALAKIADKNGNIVNLSHFKGMAEDIEFWIVMDADSQL